MGRTVVIRWIVLYIRYASVAYLIRHHPQFSDFFGDTNTAKVLVKMVGSAKILKEIGKLGI